MTEFSSAKADPISAPIPVRVHDASATSDANSDYSGWYCDLIKIISNFIRFNYYLVLPSGLGDDYDKLVLSAPGAPDSMISSSQCKLFYLFIF